MIHGISFHGDAHSKTRVNLHMKFNAFCVKGEIFPEIRIHIKNVKTCVSFVIPIIKFVMRQFLLIMRFKVFTNNALL